jgi:hypothetical protein
MGFFILEIESQFEVLAGTEQGLCHTLNLNQKKDPLGEKNKLIIILSVVLGIVSIVLAVVIYLRYFPALSIPYFVFSQQLGEPQF